MTETQKLNHENQQRFVIHCKSAANRVKGRFPYTWDLNVYRGCGHGCKYCFALYSHDYMVGTGADQVQQQFAGSSRFFHAVYVKRNLPEMLERQLSSPKWQGEVINLGGITDNYQPWEQEESVMPEVWRILIKYKNPCIISTKSDLILRDYDLIDQLSHLTYVNIASTITCMDENLAAKIEPGAVSPTRRFAMLKTFGNTNAVVGIHDMPIIPYLTDNPENLEGLFQGAKDCGAKYMLTAFLNLRGRTREVFFDFIWKEYPNLLAPLNVLYQDKAAKQAYRSKVYEQISRLRRKYHMPSDYMAPAAKKLSERGKPCGDVHGREQQKKQAASTEEKNEQLRFL